MTPLARGLRRGTRVALEFGVGCALASIVPGPLTVFEAYVGTVVVAVVQNALEATGILPVLLPVQPLQSAATGEPVA